MVCIENLPIAKGLANVYAKKECYRMVVTALNYKSDTTWKQVQSFLPPENRLVAECMPAEYFVEQNGATIHIDHYKPKNPKGTVVIFHGVGGNGRLLSFIAVPLWKNGYEVICPDLPLYGYTQYCNPVSYTTWVDCGVKLVNYFQRDDSALFLFGLSAGGMLAYQVACECSNIQGVMATCILDQRIPLVTKSTASNAVMGTVGKRLLKWFHTPFAGLKMPMKLVSNMRSIVNDKELAKLLMADTKAAGASIPIEFLYTMLYPDIKTEPEDFTKCPFLLVHPEQDNWTDLSLSRLFYDKMACEKDVKLLKSAGHFPIETPGLKELEQYCLQFLKRNIICEK